MKKIAALTIAIPYKSAGNVIRQKEVDFEVYKDSKLYSIKPMLTEMERKIANLPDSLDFHLAENEPVSTRGAKDGNLHIIKDVVQKLRDQDLIL